VIEDARNHKP